MKLKKVTKKEDYLEYKKIVKMINSSYKKALEFTKTDFQKKLERIYRVV